MNNPHFYPQQNVRLPPRDQMIMGIHAIEEVLQYVPERVVRVYTSITEKANTRKHRILKMCEDKNIPIEKTAETLLSKMTGSDSHQSYVAQIRGRKFYDAGEFLQETSHCSHVFVLMLDSIYDPQNFGAILRSAECFGVDGVVFSKNRGADLTPVVSKTSSGASELLRLIRVSNLSDTVDKFHDEGYEIITATAQSGSSQPLTQFQYPAKTVLIIGSEGEGVQPLLQKKSDRILHIPMQGKIESLNVAQATSVLLTIKLLRPVEG